MSNRERSSVSALELLSAGESGTVSLWALSLVTSGITYIAVPRRTVLPAGELAGPVSLLRSAVHLLRSSIYILEDDARINSADRALEARNTTTRRMTHAYGCTVLVAALAIIAGITKLYPKSAPVTPR